MTTFDKNFKGSFFMATREQIYTTKVLLNTEQAQNEIAKLQKKVEHLNKKRDEAWKNNDIETWKKLGKEIDSSEKKIRNIEGKMKSIDRTLSNMSDAGPKNLRQTIKAINDMLNSGTIERGSAQWKALTASLREAKGELKKISEETAVNTNVWQKFTKFLNESWGGLAMVISSVTGLSMTIRKATQDYAEMEEAMADTRKYTGLADSAVRDLNESLKGMETRTSRKELNELAGAAGRLGKDSKQDILEFVDAGNMIKVALGDDLGDGAIDKVGKLAMAFGEDEKMGLRGAMLSTGSAINELSQNSSAQAGYLVDFTARVAGFGKQIGLTQAQIMGFGAVMDENLLRDEMAATAFGNMLTKMQTDTEKFARIAGKSVTEFTELLNRDANAAILAVADSLKSQDPTTMMKMLDDMGLDGSRAVGVLATLADKIDDVRARQELATKAYREGTSVGKEYDTMNNTVQANIEKCKKQFQEMTIELGEKLLPVVKYSISSFSLMVRGLSVLTNFLINHGKTLAMVAVRLAALAVVYNAATINAKLLTAAMVIQNGVNKAAAALMLAWKAAVLTGSMAMAVLTGNVTKATAAMRTLNIVTKGHPWTAVLAVVLAVGTAVVALTEHFKKNADETQKISSRLQTLRKEHEMLSSVNKEANKSVAEEVVKFQQLRKQLEDNKNKLEDRRKALNEIKKIVPEYHGRLTTENKLINSNTSALDGYIVNLQKAARAQAAFNKMVQLQGSAMGHEQQLNERRGNRQYALNQLGRLGAGEDTKFVWSAKDMKYQMLDGQGNVTGYADDARKKQIVQYQNLVKWNDTRIKQEQAILDIEQKQTETLQRMVDDNGGYQVPGNSTAATAAGSYQPEEKGSKSGRDKKTDPYKAELDMMEDSHKQAMLLLRQRHEELELSDEEYYRQRYEGEMRYYQQKLSLQEKYGKSTVDTQNAILDRMATEATRKNTEQQQQLNSALSLAEDAYNSDLANLMRLRMDGEIATEEEYNERKMEAEKDYYRQRLAIIQQYGGDTQRAEADLLQREYDSFKADRDKRKAELEEAYNNADNPNLQNEVNDALYAQDLINYQKYQQRKQEIAQQSAERQTEINRMMYQEIQGTMQAVSSLFSAMQSAEVSEVEHKYDKQIEAARKAGKNTTKLEKKKEEEVAAIKSKYADREFQMKVLQIVADTAVGIAQLWKNPGYPWAIPLTALVAAQGAMQLAVAKKAQEQAKRGYYEGGFTGGKDYQREAGVVHEGEFVANHQAVRNPNILPFLDFIDQAQRNNTVGSLTMEDISKRFGTGGVSQVVAPVVNVQTDNKELREELNRMHQVNDLLLARLQTPIKSYVVLTGPDGLKAKEAELDRMLNDK